MSGVYALRGDEPIFDIIENEGYFIFRIVHNPVVHSYESKHHEFNRLYRMLTELQKPMVMFDFTYCEVVDSITVGILIDLTHRCRANNGNAIAVGISDSLIEMFESLMLLQPDNRRAMWTLYPTVEAADEAFPW